MIVNIVGPLRLLYLTLALAIGFGLMAAGMLSLMDGVQVSVGGLSYLDDLQPFGFSSHIYTPVLGAITIASGLAAMRRRWEVLALACWFLLGTGVMEALYLVWILVTVGSILNASGAAFVAAGVLFPILGLVLSIWAETRPASEPHESASASTQDMLRLRNTLIGLAIISYVWRVATLTVSPGALAALAYLRGTTEEYLVLESVVGASAAILLLAGIALSRKTDVGFLYAALATIAGFAFEGFLDTLDLLLAGAARLELAYALQDAVAFLACCAALALSQHAKRMPSRLTIA